MLTTISALKTLGIKIIKQRKDWLRFADKEYLLKDAQLAYRNLIKEYHPDKIGDNEQAICLTNAYNFLKYKLNQIPVLIAFCEIKEVKFCEFCKLEPINYCASRFCSNKCSCAAMCRNDDGKFLKSN